MTLWGAERIRGALSKLGIKVAKRTIQKHMRRVHYDIWFQPIFAFFIIDLDSRKVARGRDPERDHDVGRPAASERDAVR